jgi:1,4-alpha-glucan branching enzyme
MSIKKRYSKTKSLCTLTFRLDREIARAAEEASVVGDFNHWEKNASPMKRLKDGSFRADIALEPGREYEFRYLLDNHIWENDPEAERYVPTEFQDAQNSVVSV